MYFLVIFLRKLVTIGTAHAILFEEQNYSFTIENIDRFKVQNARRKKFIVQLANFDKV